MAELKPMEYIMRLDYGAQNGPKVMIHAQAVQRLVRCKECRFFYDGPDQKCCINHKGVVVTDENGFCHHAERKGEDGENFKNYT